MLIMFIARVSVHTGTNSVDPVKERLEAFIRNCPDSGEVVADYECDFKVSYDTF